MRANALQYFARQYMQSHERRCLASQPVRVQCRDDGLRRFGEDRGKRSDPAE